MGDPPKCTTATLASVTGPAAGPTRSAQPISPLPLDRVRRSGGSQGNPPLHTPVRRPVSRLPPPQAGASPWGAAPLRQDRRRSSPPAGPPAQPPCACCAAPLRQDDRRSYPPTGPPAQLSYACCAAPFRQDRRLSSFAGGAPPAAPPAPSHLRAPQRPSSRTAGPLHAVRRSSSRTAGPAPFCVRRRASLAVFLLGVLPASVLPKMHPASMGRSNSIASTGIGPAAQIQSWNRAGFSLVVMPFSAMDYKRLLPIPEPSVYLKVPN